MTFRQTPTCHSVALVFAVFVTLSFLGCQSSPEPADEPTPEETAQAAQMEEEAQQEREQRDADQAAEREARGAEISEQLSDDDLEVFARGVRAVAEREAQLEEEGRDLETRQSEASSPVEVREAEDETLAEIEDALQDEGLRFDDFMTLGQLIQESPQAIERLREFLDADEIEDFFGVEID